MRKKEQVQRTSVDLRVDNFNALKDYAEQVGSTYGRVINDLIRTFLRLPESVKDDLADYCREKYLEIDTLKTYGYSQSADAYRPFYAYEDLSDFFSKGRKSVPYGMRRIYLKDGYLICPNNWIVLQDAFGEKPENCMYAGVVEARNSEKYGIPHFVFFNDIPYDQGYTDKDEEKVYNACIKAWPRFKEILNMQVPPPTISPKDEGYMEAAEKHLASPFVGMFHITGSDDPMQKLLNRPDPFGCMIIRDGTKNEE